MFEVILRRRAWGTTTTTSQGSGRASTFAQPKAVYAIAFACVISFMGIGLVDPILPSLRTQLKATPSQVTLLFTSYLVVTAFAMLVTNWVSSRLGAKRTLVTGLAIRRRPLTPVDYDEDADWGALWDRRWPWTSSLGGRPASSGTAVVPGSHRASSAINPRVPLVLMVLGSVGVWGTGLWLEESRRGEARDVAAELDELGYAALWLSAGFGQGLPAVFGELLDATARMSVASGILSIWHATAAQSARGFAALDRAHPGRFLLGLGASHALRVDAGQKRYERPWSRMVGYLDELDAERPVVPPERRVLAALDRGCSGCPRSELPARIRTSSPLSTRRSHARRWGWVRCSRRSRPWCCRPTPSWPAGT